jgi:hypothetical protein
MTVLLSAVRNVLLHVGASVKKNKLRVVGGYVHSSGRSVTKLTAYHNSRHVASTFKYLTTTTTHCDLINFYPHRRGNLPSHDTAHDPVHHPYSDCRIVNIQLLYHASDRKSLDFCRSFWQSIYSIRTQIQYIGS